jgi:hypothetical protein
MNDYTKATLLRLAKDNPEHLAEFVQREIGHAVRRERAACHEIAMGYTRPEIDEIQTSRAIANAIQRRGWDKQHGYYMVKHIPGDDGMGTLRAIFDDTTDYTMNWLFLSTSGVHGSYTTLDDVEVAEDGTFRITALVVKPRIVQAVYGTITAHVDDIPWLREVVRKTLEGVELSQAGN